MNSETIKAIRISKNMSQAEFAASLGVAESTIATVEARHRNVSDRLRIRVAQIYGGDPEVEQAIRNAKKFEQLPK